MSDPIKILVVDDSELFRDIIKDAMKGEQDIQVIATAGNGKEALEAIEAERPDIITLDLEMPEMNGLETLEHIREIHKKAPHLPKMGIIMVSSLTSKGADLTVKGLEAGAFDFITKPTKQTFEENSAALKNQLLVKIRLYHMNQTLSSAVEPKKVPIPLIEPLVTGKQANFRAIAIGVSTGGPTALATLMPPLCEHLDLPVFIVQHMPPLFTQSLAQSLDKKCSHQVMEASADITVQCNQVYIAPGDFHMKADISEGDLMIKLNQNDPVNNCRPSVDVLFESLASIYEDTLLAILLTGMGTDGTLGLGRIKELGGYILIQDEQSSVVWGMPGSAVKEGNFHEILPLEEIPLRVKQLVQGQFKW